MEDKVRQAWEDVDRIIELKYRYMAQNESRAGTVDFDETVATYNEDIAELSERLVELLATSMRWGKT
ncbi:hypothetical protein AU152_gp62 [Mycobacterium phage Phlei]|uniref:Uncharacterized protein n=1 Tax=Mycobacterium phage Phlei TaxID=1690684 RepID=A0A0N6WN50_9CAUD|nr:hypothetical protein AU152_gp62 [Mycobacterium phage Phlei]ALA48175.1 hypothetical protein [Mycobacterium phage Phlei]